MGKALIVSSFMAKKKKKRTWKYSCSSVSVADGF